MKMYSTQNNKLIAVNTQAAKQMHNDTISGSHDIYGSFPAIKDDEDLAFGRLQSFGYVQANMLFNSAAIANDLYEHDC